MRESPKVTLIQLLIRLLGRLPLGLNQAIGVLIGWCLWLIPSKSRRNARVNLQICFPELSDAGRRKLLRRSLIETGKTATEMAYIWVQSPARLERRVREVRGAELVDATLARGQGVLVAAPHLGAWEMLSAWAARRWPVNNLYRPPRQRELESLITRARERSGATLLPATARGIRRLYKALAQGQVSAILPDQEPPGAGVFAPFFGHPAKTMTLLSKLAAQSGVPVFLAYAERLPRAAGYRLHFLPADPAIADADLERAAAALNAGIEACVRQTPTQYQWTYRRFRRQPDGRDPYSQQPL